MSLGPIELSLQLAKILDQLGIPYVLGGSLASSLVGEPRATADVDIAIKLTAAQVPRLVAALRVQFYVSQEAAQEAVQRGASCNIVHLETIQKVDLFVLGDGLLDRRQLERRFRVPLSDDPERSLWTGSTSHRLHRGWNWRTCSNERSPPPGSMGDPRRPPARRGRTRSPARHEAKYPL